MLTAKKCYDFYELCSKSVSLVLQQDGLITVCSLDHHLADRPIITGGVLVS